MTAPKTDFSSQLDLADSWKIPASRHPADALLDRGLMDNGHETIGYLPLACRSAKKRLQPMEEALTQLCDQQRQIAIIPRP